MDQQPYKIPVETTALQQLGLNNDQINMILASLTPLLQEIVEAEIAKKLTDAEEDAIERATGGSTIETMAAYDEVYKSKTGMAIQDFSNMKMNELIHVASKIVQKKNQGINKLTSLPKEKIEEFTRLVDEKKYDEAEQFVQ